jgi:hypothetical protein
MVGIQDESSHATVRWLACCRYANAAIVLSSPRDSAGTIPAPPAVSAAITYTHPIRMSWSNAGEGAKLVQRRGGVSGLGASVKGGCLRWPEGPRVTGEIALPV